MQRNDTLLTLAVLLTALNTAHAGVFHGSGACKGSGCAEEWQPRCCAPTISRRCATVYTYQRRCNGAKPTCGSVACSAATCCVPVGGARNCAAPRKCVAACKANCTAPGTFCSAGTEACCAPIECQSACSSTCRVPSTCVERFCSPDEGCGNSCGTSSRNLECFCLHRGDCCSQENCKAIARLIYASMTSCYATDRRSCIHKLGDRYDCCCHPEVMNALVYGLNDTDERVRAKAADEIGDQIRRNRCIIGSPVVCALKKSLGDCDWRVRRQAEEALELAGFDVVDGCCRQQWCHSTACSNDTNVWPEGPGVHQSSDGEESEDARQTADETAGESHDASETVTASPESDSKSAAPTPDSVPAPEDAPPAEDAAAPQTYFPSKLHDRMRANKRSGLKSLLGRIGKSDS